MARLDSFRLLLAAELPDDLATCRASASAISERIDELDRDTLTYAAAHARINALLDRIDQLVASADA